MERGWRVEKRVIVSFDQKIMSSLKKCVLGHPTA